MTSYITYLRNTTEGWRCKYPYKNYTYKTVSPTGNEHNVLCGQRLYIAVCLGASSWNCQVLFFYYDGRGSTVCYTCPCWHIVSTKKLRTCHISSVSYYVTMEAILFTCCNLRSTHEVRISNYFRGRWFHTVQKGIEHHTDINLISQVTLHHWAIIRRFAL